ncbi:DUF4357 domain-containing protein [Ornithinimicrobium sp. CNJ-824]|uniref:DUF4357 domain-containing protein n=1 Tax=Ornithinimicrobium sp. CNJ-824 TaxID=1904966 RepID=UPI00192D0E7E|nr:DUF4357 domain-containing protein [Ornithinimicrobium sp. CNJ-824]
MTSKGTNLTKSHGRYLESRRIQLATKAGRVSLQKGTAPPSPNLPEADASDREYFSGQLQIMLPVLGVNAIRVRPTHSPVPSNPMESPMLTLSDAKSGVAASSQHVDGEFTLLAGSRVVPRWHGVGKATSTQRAYAGYRAPHESLLADGSIVAEGGVGLALSRDIAFSSPSTAGAVALGRSCNGRVEWVSPGGSVGAWESRGVD